MLAPDSPRAPSRQGGWGLEPCRGAHAAWRAGPWPGWPRGRGGPPRSTPLGALAGRDEALAARPAIPAAKEGHTQLRCSPDGSGTPPQANIAEVRDPAGVTQTIVRETAAWRGQTFPLTVPVTLAVSAATSHCRGWRYSPGHANRLRAGLHPRPAPRGPARRADRGGLRADLQRQGLRQAGQPPRAGQGPAVGQPGRRPARGHQAGPARPLPGASDPAIPRAGTPRSGPGRARPGHRHLHRDRPDVLPHPRRHRRVRTP